MVKDDEDILLTNITLDKVHTLLTFNDENKVDEFETTKLLKFVYLIMM